MAHPLQIALLVVTAGILALGGYAMNMFFGTFGLALFIGLSAVFGGVALWITGGLSGLSSGGGSSSNQHRSKGARMAEGKEE